MAEGPIQFLKVHTIALIRPRIQILPDSLYCRLYVLTVVIQTIVDLAIEGELFLRVRKTTPATPVNQSTVDEAASSTMPVYLSIFALAQ